MVNVLASSSSGGTTSTAVTYTQNMLSGGASITTCGGEKCVKLVKNSGILKVKFESACFTLTNTDSRLDYFIPSLSRPDFVYFIWTSSV
jgi:hypothetical protein